jgi:hypothetical protein
VIKKSRHTSVERGKPAMSKTETRTAEVVEVAKGVRASDVYELQPARGGLAALRKDDGALRKDDGFAPFRRREQERESQAGED